jgi:hypothetical protein
MVKVNYLKDTKKFWQERAEARIALDKKREGASLSAKKKEAKQLEDDALFLKSGRAVSSKP